MAADLDLTDVALLRELQDDARLSFRQLAGRVGLSPPATAERVRRLEASGVLQGYRAVVTPAAIGRSLEAFVRVRPTDNTSAQAFMTLLTDTGAVRELHHLVGEDCFLLRIAVADIQELETFLARIFTSRHEQDLHCPVLTRDVHADLPAGNGDLSTKLPPCTYSP